MPTRPVIPSPVYDLDAWRDVTVSATFKTSDPLGRTEVVVDPDPVDNRHLLQFIDAAIVRLVAYRRAFMQAEAEDAAPVPASVPWAPWDR